MSQPLYSDRDYLDEKFKTINDRFDTLDLKVEKRMNSHDRFHRRMTKTVLAVGGILATLYAAVRQ